MNGAKSQKPPKTPRPSAVPDSYERGVSERLVSSEVLSPMERRRIRMIRHTFDSSNVDAAIRFCQRTIGQTWMHVGTKNLRRIYGLDRLPTFDPKKSYICVSNHRSFFDMYVITSYLMRERLVPHRLMFPVRSTFFYDAPLGMFVNGVMSFFAMYPPVFREREKAALNLASIDETVRLLHRGGIFVGVHPEGTRKKDDDPYTFLPAQSGVGRIIHQAKARRLRGCVGSAAEPAYFQTRVGAIDGRCRNARRRRARDPEDVLGRRPLRLTRSAA
jgi:hypothetical protein